MLHDDLAEDFARLEVLQTDVGIDRGLHVAVAKKLSIELVLAGAGLENENACGVSELMHCHPQPGCLINPLRDLAAEQGARFGACALPRKQPVIVAATEYEGPEVVDVFIDHSSEKLLKGIFQPDPVLDVVVWKGQ